MSSELLSTSKKKCWEGKNFALLVQDMGMEMKTFGSGLGKNHL